jgi:hypothetical protein
VLLRLPLEVLRRRRAARAGRHPEPHRDAAAALAGFNVRANPAGTAGTERRGGARAPPRGIELRGVVRNAHLNPRRRASQHRGSERGEKNTPKKKKKKKKKKSRAANLKIKI